MIPDSLWLLLLLSAGVIFLFMLFFADSAEGPFTQAMLIGSVAAVLTATLLVIRALDAPYQPRLGQLQPTAMERALVVLEEAREVVGDRKPPPCDAIGTTSE